MQSLFEYIENDNTLTVGISLINDISITKEDLYTAIMDVLDEGSAELRIVCKNKDQIKQIVSKLNRLYILNDKHNYLSLLVTEVDLDYMEKFDPCVYKKCKKVYNEDIGVEEDSDQEDSDQDCIRTSDDLCTCINCLSENNELKETICDTDCNCINCSNI